MNVRVSEWPVSERPRERLFEKGVGALADSELLALVLGTGGRMAAIEGARRLLADFGSVSALARATPQELALRPGMGQARAAAVVAALELGRRGAAGQVPNGGSFRSSAEVFRHFRHRLGGLRHEVFIVLLLDARHRKLREVLVSRGSLTASIVHPREVFRPAVREAAAAVLLVHNHPSGDPSPSPEDVELTRRLRESGDTLGVRVLDHIIVGAETHFSFVDAGCW